MLMLVDAFEDFGARGPKALGGSPVTLHFYTSDADAVFQRALDAGCTVAIPIADMFWGDRFGTITDPYGHLWAISTHVEDIPPEEMAKRGEAAMAEMMS